MKILTLKSIVTLSNILIYISFILMFISYGQLKSIYIDHKIAIAISLSFVWISLLFTILYFILRKIELNNSKFQLNQKHINIMRSFYISEILIIFLAITYILISIYINNLHVTRISFYILMPFTFLFSFFISVVESIVRVEERIFIIKLNWKKSDEYLKEKKEIKNVIKKANTDNPFYTKENEEKK